MDRPTFVLGVGAQKSGTTWLFNYLNHFEQADFGDLKEYHIWDGIHVPEFNEFDMRKKALTTRQFARMVKRRVLSRPQDRLVIRRTLQRNTERYFDYFAALLHRPGIEITGDITPSYSGLPRTTLAHIKDGFAARGITTKVVFLMRDPVERSLSAIRMYRRMGQSKQGVNIALEDGAALLDYLASPQSQLRVHYHETLARVFDCFDAEQVYTGFYENMFDPAEVTRLSQFLGLPTQMAFVNQKFNQTARDSRLSAQSQAQAEQLLGDVYAYCFQEFPETVTLWNKAELADRLAADQQPQ